MQDAVTPLSEMEAVDLVKDVFASATERDIYTVSMTDLVFFNRLTKCILLLRNLWPFIHLMLVGYGMLLWLYTIVRPTLMENRPKLLWSYKICHPVCVIKCMVREQPGVKCHRRKWTLKIILISMTFGWHQDLCACMRTCHVYGGSCFILTCRQCIQ